MNLSLEELKNIVHILFFVATGTVTVLAYQRAKKTILQPIKTEVFKEQIKEFSKIMEDFNGKDELELRKDFGFEKLLLFNTTKMMDSYAELFFDKKFDTSKRPYAESSTGLVSREAMGKYFTKVEDHLATESLNKDEIGRPDASTKHAIWSSYDHPIMITPNEFNEMNKKFLKLKSNPLIPAALINHLVEYQEIVRKNIKELEEILLTCSQELPTKYPNLETIKKARIEWVHSRFNKNFIDLSPKADEITNYIRSYFKTDELLKP